MEVGSIYLLPILFMIVNGIKWNIVFTNNPYDLELNGTVRLGITDRNTHTIYIHNSLQGEMLKKVLLHELTHAWLFSYGYDLSVEIEEMLCGFVDTFLFDLSETLDTLLENKTSKAL